MFNYIKVTSVHTGLPVTLSVPAIQSYGPTETDRTTIIMTSGESIDCTDDADTVFQLIKHASAMSVAGQIGEVYGTAANG